MVNDLDDILDDPRDRAVAVDVGSIVGDRVACNRLWGFRGRIRGLGDHGSSRRQMYVRARRIGRGGWREGCFQEVTTQGGKGERRSALCINENGQEQAYQPAVRRITGTPHGFSADLAMRRRMRQGCIAVALISRRDSDRDIGCDASYQHPCHWLEIAQIKGLGCVSPLPSCKIDLCK